MNTIEQLATFRVVPVVVLEELAFAAPLADALLTGGLGCAEVTLRTPASLEVITAMAEHGDVIVGAGTVLTVDQVEQAIDAGAKFLVSPGFDQEVIEYALSRGVPFIPGVATASEVLAARRLGLQHLKFFPAIPAGGVPLINALHGPFPTVRFMPTGGITLSTIDAFLSHPAVFAVGGSWMVPQECLAAGDFDRVRQLTRDTIAHIETLVS